MSDRRRLAENLKKAEERYLAAHERWLRRPSALARAVRAAAQLELQRAEEALETWFKMTHG